MYYFRKNRDKLLRKNGQLKLARFKKTMIWDLYDGRKQEIKNYYTRHKKELLQCQEYLKKNFKGYKDIIWHLSYASANEILSEKYIPEDIYYSIIERGLNNYDLAFSYMDKNIYDLLLKDVEKPETVLRMINGRLFDRNYNMQDMNTAEQELAKHNVLVLKPSSKDSGGGYNVCLNKTEIIVKRIKDILMSDIPRNSKNFIVQKKIQQSPQTALLHPNSVNTLRIMTLRKNKEIVHLSSILRMGRHNSIVDNEGSGGISSGVKPDGRLKKFAYDKFFNRYIKHPDTNMNFKDHSIPSYEQAVDLCLKSHRKLLHFDLVSWDFAINKQNKPLFIEFNLLGQAINFHQLNNGPLFGEHISYIKELLFQ